MDAPALETWIDGRAEASEVDDGTWLCDPNDGRRVQPSRSSSADQVSRALAVAAATHADGAWAAAGVAGRAGALGAFADALDAHAAAIAELDAVNTGVPISQTRLFAGSLGDTVRGAVALATERGDVTPLAADQGPVRLRRVPWGPTAVVVPWNAPSAIAVKKMAFALVSGNPVVVKPSPAAPWSAQLISAAAAATLPTGLVSTVLGGAAVGAALCADPRTKAITMTGSTPTGQAIAAAAAPHLTRLRLELSSTNPVVVRADADVAAAAQSLFDGMTKLNGQWCEAPRAVFALPEVHDALVEALGALVRAARPASSRDEATTIGPMAFADRQAELVAQRDALVAGGRSVAASAPVPEEGFFFGPTLVVGEGPALPGEVFGPMLTIESAATDAEAVARANAVAGGLAAYVFGADVEAALDLGTRLVGGEVKVNGTSLLDMAADSAQSFFGLSGIGGHGDRDVLEFYSGKQVVGRDLLDPPL